MISNDNVGALIGADVIDPSGDKIGTVGQVYLDDQDGRPSWVTVLTGLFGTKESFVPLERANWDGSRLEVPYEKDRVKDAPRFDADAHLEVSDENELYRHYGLTAGGAATGAGMTTSTDRGTVDSDASLGRDDSRTGTDSAMTRSEEQLNVGTERVGTGRARLRKYVTTEHETVTVPVQREEVRLEREPITDENIDEAMSGPDISEAEHEVVLTEERPVVSKETVPKERVRLETDTVTDQETVSADVQKEEIALDEDTDRRRDR